MSDQTELKQICESVQKGDADRLLELLQKREYSVDVLRLELVKSGEKCAVDCAMLLLDHVGNKTAALDYVFSGALPNGQTKYFKLVEALKTYHASAPSVALFHVIQEDLEDWIEPLYEIGADLDFNELELTPFGAAVSYGHVKCVNRLIQVGANVNGSKGQLSPLELAAQTGHLDCLNALLQAGADINTGYCLHLAAAGGHPQCVTALLNCGIKVNARDSHNQTPLHCAATCNIKGRNTDCISILLQRGAGINSRDEDGNKPLHLAARQGNVDCFKFLVEAGANTTQVNKKKETVLDVARNEDRERMQSVIANFNRQPSAKSLSKRLMQMRLNEDVNHEDVIGASSMTSHIKSTAMLMQHSDDAANQFTKIKSKIEDLAKSTQKQQNELTSHRESTSREYAALHERIDTEVSDVNAKIREVASEHTVLEVNTKIARQPNAIHIDHLPAEYRAHWKKMDDNLDFLAEEINREIVTDQLRQRKLLTEDQYQHVIAMTYRYKANKYLLQLIRSEPSAYLDGFKDALIKAEQDSLLDFLP